MPFNFLVKWVYHILYIFQFQIFDTNWSILIHMLVLQKKCYDCRLFLFEHLATKINIEKTESNIVKCVNYLCLNLFIKMPFFSSRNFLNMFCLIAPRQRQILAQFACRHTCLLHVCQSVNLLCLTFVRLFLHIEK